MTLFLLSAGFTVGLFAGIFLIAALYNRYKPTTKDMIERDFPSIVHKDNKLYITPKSIKS